jgi:hypothetical protein
MLLVGVSVPVAYLVLGVSTVAWILTNTAPVMAFIDGAEAANPGLKKALHPYRWYLLAAAGLCWHALWVMLAVVQVRYGCVRKVT